MGNEGAGLGGHFCAPLYEVIFGGSERLRTGEDIEMLCLSTLRLLEDLFARRDTLQFGDVRAPEGNHHLRSMLAV